VSIGVLRARTGRRGAERAMITARAAARGVVLLQRKLSGGVGEAGGSWGR
jgi:hypothetical protein